VGVGGNVAPEREVTWATSPRGNSILRKRMRGNTEERVGDGRGHRKRYSGGLPKGSCRVRKTPERPVRGGDSLPKKRNGEVFQGSWCHRGSGRLVADHMITMGGEILQS